VEEEEVLDAVVEAVVCRWCSASGAAIEEIPLPGGEDEGDGEAGGGLSSPAAG
jgi:hypothetical protein